MFGHQGNQLITATHSTKSLSQTPIGRIRRTCPLAWSLILGSASRKDAGQNRWNMALTPEERNGVLIVGLILAIALLLVFGLSAVFYAVRTLDDGMAKPPSQWR